MEKQLGTVAITHAGRTFEASIWACRYAHGGGLSVQLFDETGGGLYATVSVNVHGVPLADGEFVFKTYSENEGLLEGLLAAGAVELTGRSRDVGPVCRLALGGE